LGPDPNLLFVIASEAWQSPCLTEIAEPVPSVSEESRWVCFGFASQPLALLATTHHTSLRAARCIKCRSATLQGRATQQHEAKASNYIFLLCASVVRPFKVVPPSARG